MKSLENQIALVTGGASGIGLAISLKLAEEGAKVVIIGTNREKGALAIAEIREKTGREVQFFVADVSNTSLIEETIKNLLEALGRIDILVNNAGITEDQLLMRMNEGEWDRVLDVNLKSCYNLCHALIRSMMKAKKGKIINVSSVVGINGNTGQCNYAASKAGMIGFTKALAKEVATRGIQVNAVAPGFIHSAMTEKLNEEQKAAILKTIPMGQMGFPEDVANTVWFLASSLSNYITGQVVIVDGGMVM